MLHILQLDLLQILKRNPRTPILPCIMASSAVELQLGKFRFLLTTHTRKQRQTKCVHNLRTHLTPVYLHAQTAAHTHLLNHGYFDRGKNPNTPNWTPMPVKWRSFWGLWFIYICDLLPEAKCSYSLKLYIVDLMLPVKTHLALPS